MDSPIDYRRMFRSRTVRAATGVIVLMFLLFIAVLSFSIMREHADAQRVGESRAAAASQVVSTNALWITELSRQALARIDEALGMDIEANAVPTADRIRGAISELPGNVKAYVVAADGRTLFSTDPDLGTIDIRDREYFKAVENGTWFHVSPLLISRINDTQIFVYARRIERDGDFVAAAMISFDAILLRDMWSSLGLDILSAVSLVRNDGQLVARFPLADGPLDLSGYALFTRHLPREPSGTYPATSPADGVTRIVAYKRVPGVPLVALASVSMSEAYAPFWRNTAITLFFAIPTALALAATIVWIFRLLAKDNARRERLEETLDLNFMLVRDTHHRVKNNLQAIMSLVRLHDLPEQLKTDLQSRISAMTAVHEHLYRLDQFTETKAATLIPAIAEPLVKAFDLPVVVEYDIDDVLLDRDHATPLALVVNEVVTNALKYAFPDGRDGHIRIALKADGADEAHAHLSIADDGVGYDATSPSIGLGRRLIPAMLRQLDADAPTYTSDGGTIFSTRFPLRPSIPPDAPLAVPTSSSKAA